MVAPIVVAQVAYKHRAPIAILAGSSFASLLLIPMLLGGAPTAAADPCSGGATNATAPPAAPASPGLTAAPATSAAPAFQLPPPGTPRQNSLNAPPVSIPAPWMTAYKGAGARFGVPWTLLAGIGMEETAQGRNIATSYAGAQGPMQFLPATFKSFAIDGDGDGTKDINSVPDAIYTAANYLVKSGAKNGAAGVRKAILAYNHATWYVNDVLYYAQQYGGGTVPVGCSATSAPAVGPYETAAVAQARKWLGQPYVWGGGDANGPTTGTGGALTGFDCSGLTLNVVYAATHGRLTLPHFSTAMYSTNQMATVASFTGSGKPDLSKMRPGDVVIFNIPLSLGYDSHTWNHVGIYIGGGKLIHAAHPGTVVAVADLVKEFPYQWVARRPLAQYTGPSASSSAPA